MPVTFRVEKNEKNVKSGLKKSREKKQGKKSLYRGAAARPSNKRFGAFYFFIR